MSIQITISAAAMYAAAMTAIPLQSHTFIAADGMAWTVKIAAPPFQNWLEYHNTIDACSAAPDCSVSMIDFGNERVIAAIIN